MESTIELLERLASDLLERAGDARGHVSSGRFYQAQADAYRHSARLIREQLDALAAEREEA